MTSQSPAGPPPLPRLRTPAGEHLLLERELGRGGEARVYSLAGDASRAVKLYSRDHPERLAKLAAMLAKVPADPDRRNGHVSIAWPEALALDEAGAVRGFVMPRIDARRYLALHQLYHPRSRRSRAPGISWRYLVRIARNLCATLAALHEADYVVGDLNESNILVDDRALVTLVDLDSIQVKTVTRVFRCPVGKVEYTPPELQGRSFREVTRRRSHDRFSLAVLVFLLLMEGNHPFSGVHGGKGEPPGLEENIASRRSAWFGRKLLSPPLAAPPVEMLGPDLASVLGRALVGPAWRRPGPRDLQKALEALEANLRQCPRFSTHVYREGLGECPWCQRLASVGIESFPALGQQLPRRAPSRVVSRPERAPSNPPATVTVPAGPAATATAVAPTKSRSGIAGPGGPAAPPARPPNPARRASAGPSATAQQPKGGFQGSWLRFHRALPLLTLVLVAGMAAPAVLWRDDIQALLAALGAPAPATLPLLLVAAFLPSLLVSAWCYRQAVELPARARAFLVGERLLRSLLASTVIAFGISWLAAAAFDTGWVLSGDWLVFPPAWLVAFLIAWRVVGPKRY